MDEVLSCKAEIGQESKSDAKRMLRLRWAMWGVLSAVYVISNFHRVAPTVVSSELMAAFKTTGASLGSLGATYFYVYMIMQIPSGLLVDSLGPRKTATVGALVAGIGSIIFGNAGSLGVAFAGRLMVGLGMSVILVSIAKTASVWFREKEFATVFGMTMILGASGGLLATTPLSFMANSLGWEMSFITFGLLTVFLALMIWILVRDHPSQKGLPTIGEIYPVSPRATMAQPAETIRVPNMLQALKETVTNKRLWPLMYLTFSLFGPMMALTGVWSVPYLTQVYGLSRETATYYITFGLLPGLVCPLLVGFLSDRMGKRKLPVLVFVPLYISVWVLLAFWGGGKPPLAAIPFLFLAMGIFASPGALIITTAKELAHPSLAGLGIGVVNIGGFLGGALMQPFFGYLLDLRWQGTMVNGARFYTVDAYQFAFLFSMAVVASSLICLFMMKETGARNIYSELNQKA
ncbi:MAG: MFS transporter [Bacillota bacterium]